MKLYYICVDDVTHFLDHNLHLMVGSIITTKIIFMSCQFGSSANVRCLLKCMQLHLTLRSI